MSCSRVCARVLCAAMAVAVAGAILPPAAARAALSDAFDATCRITAPDGSRGSGCVFEISRGQVYVLTAAHVVEGTDAVQCEFWRQGHPSQPLAGRVLTRSQAADAAIVAVAEPLFGGVLPAVVPLAPRECLVRPGETLTSAGCAGGAWSTGWKGHALGYEGDDLRFLPPPANGRSGSAVFDATGRHIVALIRARTQDNAVGIATSVQAIYRAFDAPQRTGVTHAAGAMKEGVPEGDSAIFRVASGAGVPDGDERKLGQSPDYSRIASQSADCGPGGCPTCPQSWPFPLFPNRNRQNQQPPAPTPWPTLPDAMSGRPPLDVSPLDDKLGKIATMLEELKKGHSAPPPAPAVPTVDDLARKGIEAALGQVAAVRADTEKGLRDVKSETAKAQEAVSGLTAVVEKIKDSIADHGTLSQQFHARVDRVKAELEERLGREASEREVRIAYVKDLIQEKIADGGLLGLAKAIGLPAGLCVVIWLITRDVKHKRETGDPLVIEKLAAMVEGQLGTLQQRFDVLRERVQNAVSTVVSNVAQNPPQPPKNP